VKGTTCDHHNLNTALRDAAKFSAEAISFFGIIQRIYTIFTASANRWQILTANVPHLTHCAILNSKASDTM